MQITAMARHHHTHQDGCDDDGQKATGVLTTSGQQMGTLVHRWWGCITVQALRKVLWQALRKLSGFLW